MSTTATLTSLAMLKVNVDHGRDYLDYLRPFILQVLVDHKPDPITDRGVRDHIRTQYGLAIPERAIQVVLRRLSRAYPLRKEAGVYHIAGILPDPGILAKKSQADRHIKAVVSGLMEFSRSTPREVTIIDDAVTAICTFLGQSSIVCLRAYLQGSAIPTVEVKRESDIILVSQYVLHIQDRDPERFESFMFMVQGNMLANGLLCPDLQNAPMSYSGVTFYLDTPLLVRRLGLEGEPRRASVADLVSLLGNLGATVAAFAHSRDELVRVLKGAADHVDGEAGRGAIVTEARRNGTTRSDLLLMAGQVDEKLAEAQIDVKDTPQYIPDFQIDERIFEKVLDDEVSYFNPRAKDYDINSVRSIYALRAHTAPATVEKCRAVFVTSNSGFARAAWEYGQRHEESREVSSVITDFSLANMAWLKAPMGAPTLPTTEILAFSYAALQPSKELLCKYLAEINRLQKLGKITARDHQLLRSSALAQEELMRLTLGDEDALTEETVAETLRRVSTEMKREETEKLTAEETEHKRTREALVSALAGNKQVQERLYWRCWRRARNCARLVSGFIGMLLIAGFAVGLGLRSSNVLVGWVLTCGSGVLVLVSLANLVVGSTVKGLYERVRNYSLRWLIKREAAATGLALDEGPDNQEIYEIKRIV